MPRETHVPPHLRHEPSLIPINSAPLLTNLPPTLSPLLPGLQRHIDVFHRPFPPTTDAVGCFGVEKSNELIRVFFFERVESAHDVRCGESRFHSFVFMISGLNFPVYFLNRPNGPFRMLYGWSKSPGQRYMVESFECQEILSRALLKSLVSTFLSLVIFVLSVLPSSMNDIFSSYQRKDVGKIFKSRCVP
jgi:hypothetical protein